ncbi:MAG: ribonuclease III [Bacilli bacterium]|jgi:ribonuclease-3
MLNLDDIFQTFSIKPKDLNYFELAFTHSSYNADAKSKHHDYERLEFLGDSVIGLVVAELAFILHPELNQGGLSKLKASLVKTSSLANYARKFKLDNYILVGNSYINDVHTQDNILEDVLEAFIGACYLDQGYKFAHQVVKKIFYNDIFHFSPAKSQDYKSMLQEAMQSEKRKSVTYRLISATGPSHEKWFEVAVYFEDQLMGKGNGSSKKEAEQNAAKEAFQKAGRK